MQMERNTKGNLGGKEKFKTGKNKIRKSTISVLLPYTSKSSFLAGGWGERLRIKKLDFEKTISINIILNCFY